MGVTLATVQNLPFSFRRIGLVSLSAVLLSSAGISSVMAQQVPTSVDPANLEKRFESQPAPMPGSRLDAPAQMPAPRMSKEAQEQLAKKRFVLKQVIVEGATVYPKEKLQSTYAGLIGKEISLLEAQAVAQRITSMYHNDGYILSQAVVPPQTIAGGELKIRVIEGYIHNVVIDGDIQGDRQLLASYGEHLTSKRPVRVGDLERYLLLMDDLPGASAKGLVRPSSSQFGAADLVVTISHKTYEGSYTLDNRGTKFVGPWQHTGTFVANSILGLYERTLFRVVTTSPTTELRFFDLQHEEQVGSEGTRLVFDLSHSHTKPGDSLKDLEIIGDSTFFQVKAVHPFLRSRKENLLGRLIFDTRDTDTDIFQTTDFSKDRLRVIRAGGSYDFADDLLGVDLIDAQVSQGLHIFNASTGSDPTTNTDADGTFTKINLDLTRTQPLPMDFSLFTAASGQYAFQPLLAAEQFSLGGTGFGQAYDPAQLSGDHGVGAKVELRYGQALNDIYINSYQVYGYYDIGRVWIRDAAPGENDKKSLASAGIGLRTNFSEHLSANLEVGKPLTKPVSNQGDHENSPRFFFSATARF